VPHKYQAEVLNSKARYRWVIAGRRWGKTLCATMDLIRFMVEHPGCLCFWVVPFYKHLLPVSNAIRDWLPWILVKTEYSLQQTFRFLEFTNGSKVHFHSCENPDSLRGPVLDYVVLEEAAQMKDDVWPAIIQPELIDTKGKALIVSTPKGKNWLFQEYLRAKKDPESQCWQRPSSDRLGQTELDRERKRYPEDIFRQEFLAEFIEAGGSVFRNVRECFRGSIDTNQFNVLRYSDGMRIVPKEPLSNEYVFIGVDIGRHEDYTVFIALNSAGQLVGYERFTKIHYPLQKTRLRAFLEYFPLRQVALDSRGIGAGFFEDMQLEDIYIQGIQLTNPTKAELIHNLVLKLDDMDITGPYIPELVEELEAYSYEISHAGNIIYGAPKFMTDDCVMALAFAAKFLRQKAVDWVSIKGPGLMSIEEETYGTTVSA